MTLVPQITLRGNGVLQRLRKFPSHMGLTPDLTSSIKDETPREWIQRKFLSVISLAFEKMEWVDDGTAGEAHISP
jgi:hypothetical protein